jgi:hypothetical protein
MKLQDYIEYFRVKAAKIALVSAQVDKQFRLYETDEMFLPDISNFDLDLSEMCFLLGHYQFSIGGMTVRGNEPIAYQSSIILAKSVKINDWESEVAAYAAAEELAKHLYNACRRDACDNDFGYWFGKVKMSERPWTVQKVKLAHDNTVGVEIRFQFTLNTNAHAHQTANPFLI